jgi:hypothetical protein
MRRIADCRDAQIDLRFKVATPALHGLVRCITRIIPFRVFLVRPILGMT